MEKFAHGEINERDFSNCHPGAQWASLRWLDDWYCSLARVLLWQQFVYQSENMDSYIR